jgi:anaerobic selenocysteine-containing dehydrogenase
MHPQDLAALGIPEGALIEVRSRHGTMLARVEADDSLRIGLVSVVHGFGGSATHAGPDDELPLGSVTRLVGMDERDPISGIPRMSALPIAVRATPSRG